MGEDFKGTTRSLKSQLSQNHYLCIIGLIPFTNPDYAGILHYVPQWGEQSDRYVEPNRRK